VTDVYDKRPTVIITPGQRKVLDELLRTGGSNEQIGKALYLSEYTVKSQLSELMKRTGSVTRTELVVRVMRDQFVIGIARQHKPPVRGRNKAVEVVDEG
jgi:DNA-binding NarL/FixJ family response regulator